MSCRSLLTHAEPDVGGTSLYALVTCPEGGNEARAPRMVVDSINKARRYEVHLLKKLEGDVGGVRYSEGLFKFSCTKKCSFTLKVWAQTGTPVYPFLTDVGIIRNSGNLFAFKARATSVKERGGTLVLQRVGTSKVIDIRYFDPMISLPILLAEPTISPRRSFFYYSPGETLYFWRSGRGEEVGRVKGVKVLSSYFYGFLVAAVGSEGIKVFARKKGGWDEIMKENLPEERPLDADWCAAWNSPTLALYFNKRLELRSVGGESLVVNLPKAKKMKISPDAKTLLVVTEDGLDVIDMDSGDVIKRFKLPKIDIVSWSYYSDFAALCSSFACWIYSTLSNSLILVKLMKDVTSAWWSPSTYNLYLTSKDRLRVLSFDPRGVRAVAPVARRPIPRETS